MLIEMGFEYMLLHFLLGFEYILLNILLGFGFLVSFLCFFTFICEYLEPYYREPTGIRKAGGA